MEAETYFLFIFLFGLIDGGLGEYCTESYSTYYGTDTRTIYCSNKCCGPEHDEYCCYNSTGVIVGAVFAGIFTISVIVAVICCCIKHKGQRGRVIQQTGTTPHSTHNVFIVPSTGPTPPAYSNTFAPPACYPTPGGYSAAMPPEYSTAQPPEYLSTTGQPKYP